MKYISIFFGKIVAYLCTMVGRGSSFPGTFAAKIDRNILSKFVLPSRVIVVRVLLQELLLMVLGIVVILLLIIKKVVIKLLVLLLLYLRIVVWVVRLRLMW